MVKHSYLKCMGRLTAGWLWRHKIRMSVVVTRADKPRFFPPAISFLQVGYKRMLYMCLHAESVLDLIEKPERWVPCLAVLRVG